MLSYRRKYLRACWGSAAVLLAILLLQGFGWLPAALAGFGVPHAAAAGWASLAVCCVWAAGRIGYARGRWVTERRHQQA